MPTPLSLQHTLRLLRVAPPTATAWMERPDDAIPMQLTLQFPTPALARLGAQVRGAPTSAAAWYLQDQARRADSRRDSDVRRVASTLERLGAREVHLGPHAGTRPPTVYATLPPRLLGALHHALGPTLDTVAPAPTR